MMRTLALPARKSSRMASRSAPSKAPWTATTLWPSAVKRSAIRDAVSRFCFWLARLHRSLEINPCLHKNDRRSDSHQAVEMSEDVVFAFIGWAIHVHLLDTTNSELIASQCNLIGFRAELFSVAHDLVRKCG